MSVPEINFGSLPSCPRPTSADASHASHDCLQEAAADAYGLINHDRYLGGNLQALGKPHTDLRGLDGMVGAPIF